MLLLSPTSLLIHYVPDERYDTPTLSIGELLPPDLMNIVLDQVDAAVVVPEAPPGLDESHQVEAPLTRSRPRPNVGLLLVRGCLLYTSPSPRD